MLRALFGTPQPCVYCELAERCTPVIKIDQYPYAVFTSCLRAVRIACRIEFCGLLGTNVAESRSQCTPRQVQEAVA